LKVDNGFCWLPITTTILEDLLQRLNANPNGKTRFQKIFWRCLVAMALLFVAIFTKKTAKNQMIQYHSCRQADCHRSYLRQLESFNGADPDEDGCFAGHRWLKQKTVQATNQARAKILKKANRIGIR